MSSKPELNRHIQGLEDQVRLETAKGLRAEAGARYLAGLVREQAEVAVRLQTRALRAEARVAELEGCWWRRLGRWWRRRSEAAGESAIHNPQSKTEGSLR